jgi:hypothetical protein
VAVGELRRAFNEKQVILNKPKGAEEGFELRVAWPSAVASSDGVVSSVSSSRIQFKRKIDSRTITLALEKNGVILPFLRSPLLLMSPSLRQFGDR